MMTPFLAGTLFGFLFAGSLFVVFVTRNRASEPRHEPQWDDPFDDPSPVVQHIQSRKLVTERTFK